jgi:hypothetical protein
MVAKESFNINNKNYYGGFCDKEPKNCFKKFAM